MKPEVGPRCGECRLGLGVHNTADPLCSHHAQTRPPECPTKTPERHGLGDFPMTCYRCHIKADT